MQKKHTIKNFITFVLVIIVSVFSRVQGQDKDTSVLRDRREYGPAAPDTLAKKEKFSYHFQTTMVDMYHTPFSAPYTGKNSLVTSQEHDLSITSTMFLGTRLWRGAEIYFNPELSGGQGFSATSGIAAFPNGEIYRVGSPVPVISISRIFLRQIISLSSVPVCVDGAQNQLCDSYPADKLIFTFGKFAITDMYDANTYSHDPRNQFMNWAMMSAGAWDYPANTRGYTYGFVAELIHPGWSLKGSIVMEPEVANGPYLDMDIAQAHAETVEFDKMFSINHNPGAVRVIGFYNQADMGNYKEAIADYPAQPDVTLTRNYAHDKYGFVVNAEQRINENIGVFGRLSWDNGASESWAFTEIDQSLCLGGQLKGSLWKRPTDQFGAAYLNDGLSKDHRDYLAAGGYGFIIGDGQLNYGHENVIELYYSAKLFNNFWLSPDDQLLINPAYNKDRGPVVNIYGVRGHLEF